MSGVPIVLKAGPKTYTPADNSVISSWVHSRPRLLSHTAAWRSTA